MPDTARGVPYPSPGADNNVPTDVFNLASWVNDHPGVATLTTTERNALAGAALWDGRIILNTTLDLLQRYDAGLAAWVSMLDERSPYLKPLGYATLDNGSPTSITTSASAAAPADTGLQLSLTVPVTGLVWVFCRGFQNSSGGSNPHPGICVKQASSVVAGTRRVLGTETDPQGDRIDVAIRISDTPGASRTWKIGYYSEGGATVMGFYYGGNDGPLVMEAWG